MNPIIDTIYFADPKKEGLDSDTNENYIPKGHSRYRLNCRSGSSGGSVGVVENVKGNTLVSFPFETEEDHYEIGSCDDAVNNHIYYFIAGDNADHLILRYDATFNQIVVVVRSYVLNFSKLHRIHNPKYIDGSLVWVDDINPPRSIIVENAINNYDSIVSPGIDCYFAITDQVLDGIIYPPAFPPEIEYFDDTARSINNLRGAMWQFSYQYVYVDDHKSTWSTYSKVGKPLFDENVDGRYFEDQTINNCIKVTVNTGTNEVKRVNIAVRDSNISDWVLIESIEKYDSTGKIILDDIDYVYDFYNDYRGTALDQGDFVRPFDYVPLIAKSQEISDDERVIYGNYLDGFDNVEVEVDISKHQGAVLAANNPTTYTPTLTGTGVPDDSAFYVGSNYALSIILPPPLVVEIAQYKIMIRKSQGMPYSGLGGYPVYGTTPAITTQDVNIEFMTTTAMSLTDILDGIADEINTKWVNEFGAKFTTYPFAVSDPTNFRVKLNLYADYVTPSFTTQVTDSSPVILITVTKVPLGVAPKKAVLKQGSLHQFGIVYHDKPNRNGYVNNKKFYESSVVAERIYIKTSNEIIPNTSSLSYPYEYVKLSIKNNPPSWATHYQVVHTGNQTIAKSFSLLLPMFALRKDATDKTVRVIYNSYITDEIFVQMPNTSYGTYEYAKGDRMRFIYTRLAYSSSPWKKYLPEVVDVEIIGYDDTTGEIILPDFHPDTYGLLGTASGGTSTAYGFLCEIYTPSKKKEENTLFYEIGECYEIGNAGTILAYHKGNEQNQDPANPTTTPAIVSLEDYGDSYLKSRCFVGVNIAGTVHDLYTDICESEDFSDYYPSDSYDFGRRFNKINRDAKQRWYYNYYRHGGRKYPMTNLNFMFKFDYDDFDSVSVDDGEITGLRQIGYTLKILQQKKITSQYMSRTELVDTRGNTSLQKSDKVFGSKNPSELDYGCFDAGSILANDRHLYFLDVAKGCYVRDSANGLEPISLMYMDNFWKEVCKKLSNNKDNYHIHTVFHKEYGELYITFRAIVPQDWHGDFQDDFTICFHEDSNRWKSFWSFLPEGYGITNNVMVSWLNGQLYRHEANATYNYFYGTQYKMLLDLYSNDQPKQVKLYRSLTVHSNRLFYCPNTGDIMILPTDSYPNGMMSRLSTNQFDPQEGIWYAAFMNDMLDPRFATALDALFNGRELRGRAIKIQLTSDGNLQTQLDFVTVNSMISEISN